MNAITPPVLYRPPPAPDHPPAVNDGDLRGIMALVGLNLDGLAECLALIEEVRFAPSTPQHVREAMGEPMRAARASLEVAKAWLERGMGRG